MSNALNDVAAERQKQKSNPDVQKIENENTINDFVAYISAYAGRASTKVLRNEREGVTSRDMLVKAGALAVAAVEAIDRGTAK